MKSAYERAMEKFQTSEQQPALNDAQRAEIAELNTVYQAKIAERKTFLQGKKASAEATGDFQEAEQFAHQLARDILALEEELQAKKDKIWKQSK